MKSIVILDDSPVIMGLVKKSIEGVDAEIMLSRNYGEVEKHLSENTVDVLITDLNVDDDDGFALVEMARQSKHNAEIDCYVMSAESPLEYREKMQKLDVKGWVIKPINPLSFNKALKEIVKADSTH